MKPVSALFSVLALAVCAQASGASLTMTFVPPSIGTPQAPQGGQLSVLIQGSGFADGSSGGDFLITFSNSLQYLSGVPGSQFDTSNLPADVTPSGSSSPIRVDVFRSISGVVGAGGSLFDVATLTFNVVGQLAAPVTLSLGQSFGWTTANGLDYYTGVTYSPGPGTPLTASVAAVPAPGALWLLATGIGALAARRKLKAA